MKHNRFEDVLVVENLCDQVVVKNFNTYDCYFYNYSTYEIFKSKDPANLVFRKPKLKDFLLCESKTGQLIQIRSTIRKANSIYFPIMLFGEKFSVENCAFLKYDFSSTFLDFLTPANLTRNVINTNLHIINYYAKKFLCCLNENFNTGLILENKDVFYVNI